MLEIIFGFFLEITILVVVLPVSLLLATPFIFFRAAKIALTGKQKFSHATEDGYTCVVRFFER